MTITDHNGSATTSWSRAMTVGERAYADLACEPTCPVLHSWARVLDLEVTDPSFAHAVQAIGFSVDDLHRQLCGEEPLAPSTPPRWAVTVPGSGGTPSAGRSLPDEPFGLLRLVEPLVRDAQARLRADVADAVTTTASGDRLAALPALLSDGWPAGELAMAVGPTMVLELNVARVRETLAGATPEDRFASFVRSLGRPEAATEIWAEYPVLQRYVHGQLRDWRNSRTRFAEQLVADLPELDATFGPPTGLGACREVRFGAGDRHRGGLSVAIVTFEHGTVVYKPRSLAVDEAWLRTITWFNDRRPPHPLATPPVLDRTDHGWVGFVPRLPCRDRAETRDHYWRLGALLALLYALRARDMHAENLIASGAQPVVVDVEALLQPTPAQPVLPWSDPAAQLIAEGVTSIGLLPQKLVLHGDDGPGVLDLSAVGAPDHQVSPMASVVPIGAGTDLMRLVDERTPIGLDVSSRPRIGADLADPREYRSDLVAGFRWAYRLIAARRQDWLGPHGLLAGFAQAPIRYIARPTAYYARLLRDSLHPDYLRDARDRDRTFFRLALGADGRRPADRLVPSELADLRAGDIPFFECRPNSRDVWDARGIRLPELLDRQPIEAVAERVGRLCEADLDAQVALIRQAFASLESGLVSALRPPQPSRLADEPLDAAAALAAATRIGHRLTRSAIRLDGEVGWVALRLIEERYWSLDTSGADLYAGLPGIGLFLSWLARLGGDPEITETARTVARVVAGRSRRAAEQLTREITQRGELSPTLRRSGDASVFGPFGGAIYHLAHAAVLHDDPELLDAAESLLPVLRQFVVDDPAVDLVGGAAGAILAALALDRLRPGSGALDVATTAGRRIVADAVEAGDGLAWRPRFDSVPLTGMSHGAAGIAFALSRLDQRVPDPAFRSAVDGALRYERGLRAAASNWPDLRPDAAGGGDHPLLAWCHGAPGIGLARLEVLDHPGLSALHPLAEDDVRVAEDALWGGLCHTSPHGETVLTGLGTDGACHGTLGNLDLPLALARRRGDPAAEDRCRIVAATVVRDAARRGWRTGVPDVEGIPGLMYGLSGIGYQLLRLADPTVPSLLLLEPPSTGGPR